MDNLSSAFNAFSSLSTGLFKGLKLKEIGEFLGGSADLGKGILYMVERIQETLNIK